MCLKTCCCCSVVIYTFPSLITVCFWILTDRNSGTAAYKVYYIPMTWFNAQTYCRTYHTDLVSIQDTSEQAIVKGLYGAWLWIGLYRGRSWNWSDQTIMSNISWSPGQPDLKLAYGFCGYLNGHIGNAPCSDGNFFICQKSGSKFNVIFD